MGNDRNFQTAKNPCIFRGLGVTRHKPPVFRRGFLTAHSPSSCGLHRSAGIGTLPVRTSGLPGFIGPSPSTSLDESDLTYIRLYQVYATQQTSHAQWVIVFCWFLFYTTHGHDVNCRFWSFEMVSIPEMRVHLRPLYNGTTTVQISPRKKSSQARGELH